jgi:chromosome segregation ATPase
MDLKKENAFLKRELAKAKEELKKEKLERKKLFQDLLKADVRDKRKDEEIAQLKRQIEIDRERILSLENALANKGEQGPAVGTQYILNMHQLNGGQNHLDLNLLAKEDQLSPRRYEDKQDKDGHSPSSSFDDRGLYGTFS